MIRDPRRTGGRALDGRCQRAAILLELAGKVRVLAALEALGTGGFLVLSILKFRFLGPETAGMLSFFAAAIDLPGAFCGHFNRPMSRFGAALAARERVVLLLTSVSIQYAVYAAFGLAGAAALLILGPEHAPWNKAGSGALIPWVFAAMAATMPFTIAKAALGAACSSYGYSRLVQTIRTSLSWTTIAGLLVSLLVVGDRLALALCFTGAGLCTAVLHAAVLATVLWKRTGMAEGLRGIQLTTLSNQVKATYINHVHSYSGPLQAVSIFAYFKENIALLVLGNLGFMVESAMYSLANRLFTVPEKFIPNILELVMPKMATMADRDPVAFAKKYIAFAWAQFGFHVLVAFAVLAAHAPIMALLKVAPRPEASTVFLLFSGNMVVAAIIQTNLNLIMLQKTTSRIVLPSMTRSIFVTALTIAVVPAYTTLGAAAVMSVSTVLMASMLVARTRDIHYLPLRTNIQQALACVPIFAALTGLAALVG